MERAEYLKTKKELLDLIRLHKLQELKLKRLLHVLENKELARLLREEVRNLED